jgi:hypothetical protein
MPSLDAADTEMSDAPVSISAAAKGKGRAPADSEAAAADPVDLLPWCVPSACR